MPMVPKKSTSGTLLSGLVTCNNIIYFSRVRLLFYSLSKASSYGFSGDGFWFTKRLTRNAIENIRFVITLRILFITQYFAIFSVGKLFDIMNKNSVPDI